MAGKKEKKLTRAERIDIIKAVGKGILDLANSGPVPRYTITTLGLYALGRTCIIPPILAGSIQGINTIMAVEEVTEDSGIGGITKTFVSGGSGIAAGVLMTDLLCKKCGCPAGTSPSEAIHELGKAAEDVIIRESPVKKFYEKPQPRIVWPWEEEFPWPWD